MRIRRYPVPRPRTLIPEEEFDESKYVKVESWDPYFWEKATHYRAVQTQDEDGTITTHYISYYREDQFDDELKGGEGYVYILTCPSQPNVLKIGSTERTPQERLAEINNATGVIVPWEVAIAYKVKAPRTVEMLVHERLSDVRFSNQREGFILPLEKAKEIVEKVVTFNKAELNK